MSRLSSLDLDDFPEFLTVSDVAQLLRRQIVTVQCDISRAPWRLPPFIRLEGRRGVLFARRAVLRWLEEGEKRGDVKKWIASRCSKSDANVQEHPDSCAQSHDMSRADVARSSTKAHESNKEPSEHTNDEVLVLTSASAQKSIPEALKQAGVRRYEGQVVIYYPASKAGTDGTKSKDAQRQQKCRASDRQSGVISVSLKVNEADKQRFQDVAKMTRLGTSFDNAVSSQVQSQQFVAPPGSTPASAYSTPGFGPWSVRPVFLGLLAGQGTAAAAYIVGTFWAQSLMATF